MYSGKILIFVKQQARHDQDPLSASLRALVESWRAPYNPPGKNATPEATTVSYNGKKGPRGPERKKATQESYTGKLLRSIFPLCCSSLSKGYSSAEIPCPKMNAIGMVSVKSCLVDLSHARYRVAARHQDAHRVADRLDTARAERQNVARAWLAVHRSRPVHDYGLYTLCGGDRAGAGILRRHLRVVHIRRVPDARDVRDVRLADRCHGIEAGQKDTAVGWESLPAFTDLMNGELRVCHGEGHAPVESPDCDSVR